MRRAPLRAEANRAFLYALFIPFLRGSSRPLLQCRSAGIPIVRALADDLSYERRDGRNRFTILFRKALS
jgi:hypothetical protein